jgi:hypothetical protein
LLLSLKEFLSFETRRLLTVERASPAARSSRVGLLLREEIAEIDGRLSAKIQRWARVYQRLVDEGR